MRDESELAPMHRDISRWARTKDLVADILLMVFGGWLLFHFVMFWQYGWVFVGESCRPWLAVETTLAVVVIALGIDRLLDHTGGR